jgi:hypothetical protein
MSWVIYRDSDLVVLDNMSTDPGDPGVGFTKIERTPDEDFNPSFTTNKYVYNSGTDSFDFIGPFFVADLSIRSHTGAMINMTANGTEFGRWGDASSTAGITMPTPGEITRMSITLDNPRTAGTAKIRMVIDGVEQNGVDKEMLLDGTNPVSNFILFSTPILYDSNTIISMVSKNNGFSPTSADATIAFWYTGQDIIYHS